MNTPCCGIPAWYSCACAERDMLQKELDRTKEVLRKLELGVSGGINEALEKFFMENVSQMWPDDDDRLASRKALSLVCSFLLGNTTPPLDVAALISGIQPKAHLDGLAGIDVPSAEDLAPPSDEESAFFAEALSKMK